MYVSTVVVVHHYESVVLLVDARLLNNLLISNTLSSLSDPHPQHVSMVGCVCLSEGKNS